jgi:hypothetical protein
MIMDAQVLLYDMKRYRNYLIFLIALLYPNRAISQTEPTKVREGWVVSTAKWVDNALYSSDTGYVKIIPCKYMVMITNPNWLDFYSFEMRNKTNILLQSDLCYNLGFNLGYKSISLGYSFNLTDVFTGKPVRNKEWDFQISSSRFSVDLYYMNNNGQTNISGYKDSTGIHTISEPFDGLKIKSFEADIYYYFNSYRYSNAAAYSNVYMNQQIKSAGSFITGISYAMHDVFFDFTKLSIEKQFLYIEELGTQRILYRSYCLNLGYGYNLAFSKRWLANLTCVPAVGVNVYQKNSTTPSPNNQFSLNSKMKAALVYNKPNYFVGLSCYYYSNWYFTDNYTLINSMGTFNVFFGLRF